MIDVVEDVRSLVGWVYVTCDTQIALKVAVKCKAITDSHDKLTRENKMLLDALSKANGKLIDISNSLYGKGFEITGCNLNGNLEPIDSWFEDSDWEVVEVESC